MSGYCFGRRLRTRGCTRSGAIRCAAASILRFGGKGDMLPAQTSQKSGSGRLDFAYDQGENRVHYHPWRDGITG
jgi:hypothetical protein